MHISVSYTHLDVYKRQLVGCVRVLSDLHFRSVIYDLAALINFQNKGIGTELVRRCRSACESSEWLVQTDKSKAFYEKIGFQKMKTIS